MFLLRTVHAGLSLAVLLTVFAAPALAHGGIYRPPPKIPPRDPIHPGGGLSPTTQSQGTERGAPPWQRWWQYNAERLLKVRARVLERTAITGTTKKPTDVFDRAGLRAKTLVPLMLEALSDPSADVRVAAAIALGKFRAKAARAPLLERYESDKDRNVRDAAIVGLMLLRDPTLRDRFRAIVRDQQPTRRTRGLAVLALGFVRDTEFLAAVLRRPRSVKVKGTPAALDELRACAAVALGHAGSPAAAGPLIETCWDKQAPRGARGFAAVALGRAGGPIAVPDILRMVRNEDTLSQARYGAAIAAGLLVSPGDHAAMEILGRKAERDKDGGVRALLFMSLGRIGGPRATKYLLRELDTNEQTIRGFLLLALGMCDEQDAVDQLKYQLLRIKHPGDRGACALALGLAGRMESAPSLRKLVAQGRDGEREWGLLALGLLGDTSAAPLARDVLHETNNPRVLRQAAVSFALLRGAAAVPDLLVRMKKSKSTHFRVTLARVLGLVGTRRAVDTLIAMYRDPKSSGVDRALAIGALGGIGSSDAYSPLSEFAFDFNPYAASDAVRLIVTLT